MSQLCSATDSFCERKAHGCIRPLAFDLCERTARTPTSEASTSTTNWSPGSRRVSMGAVVNFSFRNWKASSACLDQMKGVLEEDMALPFVMVLPLLIVVAAGVYYIYNGVMQFMSKSLVRNKVVVITDAVSGVGTDCAHLFHKGGARLILCGTSWDKLESLYDSLTNDADPRETFAPKLVILDFSDMQSMEDVVAEVVDCYGCVDVLICNSSMKLKAPVQSVSLELDRNIMDINYFGPSTLAKGVLPTMISRRSGHIVLVNSIQGRLAVPFRSSYAASKHAVQAFFDCLRAEVEEYGIVVSTISHTFINASNTTPVKDPAPKPSSLSAFIARQMSHGVRPSVLANEIMQMVNRKRKEVVMAHPIPRAALYFRSLFPSLLFAVLGAGVKDATMAEQMQ